MGSNERQARFIKLLEELLIEYGGIQTRLAEQLGISSARLSSWFQRKVDPANLETSIFERIAKVKKCSTDELANILCFTKSDKLPPNRFKNLIVELLSNQTQEQLGTTLGVKQTAISHWINPDKNIDPGKINAGIMFAIAQEKGWKFDDILSYIGIKDKINTKELLIKYKTELDLLSLKDQIELLAWLSVLVDRKMRESTAISKINTNQQKILLILEKEDIYLAYHYPISLLVNIDLNPDNINATTIAAFPEILEKFDLLIFDIDTNASAAIDRINKISFDGDVVIFTSPELEAEVRQQLEDKVTDIVVKPIDWQELKNKPYFM